MCLPFEPEPDNSQKFNIYLFLALLGLHCLVGFSLIVASRGCSLLRCAGFSLWWLLLLRSTGSRQRASVVAAHGLSSCSSQALDHWLSSCGPRAQLLCGRWDPPRPGIEPVSVTLAGRLFTTGPPGKSPKFRGDFECPPPKPNSHFPLCELGRNCFQRQLEVVQQTALWVNPQARQETEADRLSCVALWEKLGKRNGHWKWWEQGILGDSVQHPQR